MNDAPVPLRPGPPVAMRRGDHWNRFPLLDRRNWPRSFFLALEAAREIDRAVKSGFWEEERVARARFGSAIDAIVVAWPELVPITTAAAATARQRWDALVAARARAAAIVEMCGLAGRPEDAEAFIAGGLPANDVLRVLQATGADAAADIQPHA